MNIIFFSVNDLNSSVEEFCSSVLQKEQKYCPKLDAYIGYTEFSYQNEVLHGFYREVIRDKVSQVGIYINGVKNGLLWKTLGMVSHKLSILTILGCKLVELLLQKSLINFKENGSYDQFFPKIKCFKDHISLFLS